MSTIIEVWGWCSEPLRGVGLSGHSEDHLASSSLAGFHAPTNRGQAAVARKTYSMCEILLVCKETRAMLTQHVTNGWCPINFEERA